MKKTIKLLPLLGIVLLMAWGCNSGSSDSAATSQNKRDTVIIKMMAFQPETITVNKGDTIVWINQDIVAHDVSQLPDRTWHSETLEIGDSFMKVIEDSSSYFCSIHPTMVARFLVNE